MAESGFNKSLRRQECASCNTGAADGTIKVWDARQLGGSRVQPLHTFAVHTEAVMRVEWSPHHAGGLVRPQTLGIDCQYSMELACCWNVKVLFNKHIGPRITLTAA